MREVAHDGQQAGDVEAGAAVVHKGLDVAKTVAGPPRLHVVGVPERGHDNGEDVFDLDDGDEDDGGKLAVAVEQPQRHEADEVGDDAEDDAHGEVGREGRGDERGHAVAEHDDERRVVVRSRHESVVLHDGMVYFCVFREQGSWQWSWV